MCVLSYTAWALRRDGYSSQLLTRSLGVRARRPTRSALVYICTYGRTHACENSWLPRIECMISQQFTRARITSRLIGEIGR